MLQLRSFINGYANLILIFKKKKLTCIKVIMILTIITIKARRQSQQYVEIMEITIMQQPITVT